MGDLKNLERNWPDIAHRAKYSIATMASMCGWSVRQFERNFKQMMYQPPKSAVMGLRLRAARKLLNDRRSIKEVAYSVGYKHPEHFARDFRKHFGVSPSEIQAGT